MRPIGEASGGCWCAAGGGGRSIPYRTVRFCVCFCVLRGTKIKTSGGLVKGDLIKSKTGKIVSKKASARAKLTYKKNGLAKWIAACLKARKDLKLKGFVAIGGTCFY